MSAEQISPELVLVDPELAARARAALPWAPTSYAPAAPRAAPVPPPEPEPPRARRSITVRVPVGATLWLLGGTAILLTLAFGAVPSSGDRPRLLPAPATTESAARPAPVARPPAASPPPARAPTQPRVETLEEPATKTPTSVAVPPRPAPKPVAPQPSPQPAAPAARNPPPARPRPAPAPGFQPARVFGWAPQAGASYYHVVFLRGGRPFYEAWPRVNRLPLPKRVRFRPGRYTWTVEPGSGDRSAGRLGSPIVKSSFTVGG